MYVDGEQSNGTTVDRESSQMLLLYVDRENSQMLLLYVDRESKREREREREREEKAVKWYYSMWTESSQTVLLCM